MPALKHAFTIVTMVVIAGVFIFLVLDAPGGPTHEATGVVEDYAFTPEQHGPPTQIASVRLSDGTLVRAHVTRNVLVQPGRVARLRIYRRVVTGTAKYELIAIEERK